MRFGRPTIYDNGHSVSEIVLGVSRRSYWADDDSGATD